MESLEQQFRGLSIEQRLALYEPLYPSAVELKKGSRQICKNTPKGWTEYRRRRNFVWEVYDRKCWLCGQPVSSEEVTADHRDPRGMGGGSRDDRVEAIRPCHGECNTRRGSRRIAGGESCPYCEHGVVVGGKKDRECFRCNAKWEAVNGV